MVFDYLHTFPEEASSMTPLYHSQSRKLTVPNNDQVELIWPSKLSIPKFLFLSVRYGNMVYGAFVYLGESKPVSSGDMI